MPSFRAPDLIDLNLVKLSSQNVVPERLTSVGFTWLDPTVEGALAAAGRTDGAA